MCQTTSEINNPNTNQYKIQIIWTKVAFFIYLHLAALYGLYLFFNTPSLATFFWTYFLVLGTTQGVGAGAHRLWTHRTYKAKLPLRIYLAFFQTLALQKHIYDWCRDHRVHHKFVDTDADPHNANRGFFFSHMGWLMVKKHPDVITKGKILSLSDLEKDPVVCFQKRYYLYLAPLCGLIIPAFVPWYFWNESFALSWNFCAIFRYLLTLHGTCLVNSWAHIYGNRPYNKFTKATETKFVSYLTNGEGFHNYHHTFPWDYKAAELDSYSGNLNIALIDLMAKIGWAYDLKTVTSDLIESQCKRRGDGSRPIIYMKPKKELNQQG